MHQLKSLTSYTGQDFLKGGLKQPFPKEKFEGSRKSNRGYSNHQRVTKSDGNLLC